MDLLNPFASLLFQMGLDIVLDLILTSLQCLFDWTVELALVHFTALGALMFFGMLIGMNAYIYLKPLLESFLYKVPYDIVFAETKYDLAKFFTYYGKFFHRHEVIGFENIPSEGGALITYFHAAVPLDYILLAAKVLLEKKRTVNSVVDKVMYMMPGLRTLSLAFSSFPGSRPECVKRLQQGNIVGVAPGGGYEAQVGSNRYDMLWKNRLGFATAAIEAGVPIIPVFTENCREVVVNLQMGRTLSDKLYNLTKLPLVPVYGWFPVKLRTHVGQPIYPEEGMTAQELRDKTAAAIEQLIRENQKIPGNIFRAIGERIMERTEVDYHTKNAPFEFSDDPSLEVCDAKISEETAEDAFSGYEDVDVDKERDLFERSLSEDDILAPAADKSTEDDDGNNDDDNDQSSGIASMGSSSGSRDDLLNL